jgi:hypothetical protein
VPVYRLPRRMIEETFAILRSCGANERECQLYWLSPWSDPFNLTEVTHPKHQSTAYALSIESDWLNSFWLDLADREIGARIQVHTHAFEAFHSATDDAYPLLSDVGFLSLVIPSFAMGPIGFQDAYLTEIQPDGRWQQVDIDSRLRIDG